MKCTSEHDHHIVMRFLLTWSAQMVPIMEFGSNQLSVVRLFPAQIAAASFTSCAWYVFIFIYRYRLSISWPFNSLTVAIIPMEWHADEFRRSAVFCQCSRKTDIIYIYMYIYNYIYIHTDFQCRERGRVWWHTADHVFLPTSSGPQETLKISFPTKHEQASKYTLCARGIVWHNFPLAAEMISFPWPRQSTSPETQTSSKFGNTHPSVDSPSPGL